MKFYRGKHTICLSSTTYLSEYKHLYLIWIFSAYQYDKTKKTIFSIFNYYKLEK